MAEPVDPAAVVQVTVVLHPAQPLPLPGAGGPRTPMTHVELAERHGARPEDVERVVAFALAHGLHVVELRPDARLVKLAGPAAAMQAAFDVTLEYWELADGRRYHSHSTPVRLPADLHPRVMAVLGLDDRPVGQPARQTPIPAAADWWPSGGSIDTNVEVTSTDWATWRGRAVDLCLVYNTRDSGWTSFLPSTGQPAVYTSPAHRLVIQTPPFPTGMGNTYSALNAGSYDSHWTTFGSLLAAQDAAAGRLPSIVNIGWEANGSYFEWGYNSAFGEKYTSAAQYIAGFQRIATVLRTAYPAVKIGWIMNGHANPMAASSIFPGAAYVDYIGADYYDMYPASTSQSDFTALAETADQGILWYLQLCDDHNKLLLIPEWGVVHDTSYGGGDNPDYVSWMVDVFQQAQNVGLMGGETYFTYDQSDLLGGQNPLAAARYRQLYAAPASTGVPTPRPGPNFLTAPEVGGLYNFPPNVDGAGQTVGIIMLNAGIDTTAFGSYCASLGLTPNQIATVLTDGQTNDPSGADTGELMLDVEMVAAAAQGARIVLYLSPDNGTSWLNNVHAAVYDSTYAPSVLTMSLAIAEPFMTSDFFAAFETSLHAAALLGTTVLAASGDWGSAGLDNDGLAHVDYPASSQWVLGVGGTVLTASANHAAIVSEVGWDNSGGGVSELTALPSWQAAAGVPPSVNPGGFVGRGVPDVAAHAAYFWYWAAGATAGGWLGGTSASSPLLAGLVARINQLVGYRVGHIHEWLYAHPEVFRDLTTGDIGAYDGDPGWDAVTGLGVIDGAKMAAGLYGTHLIATPNASKKRVDLKLSWQQFPTAYIYRYSSAGHTLIGPVTLTGGIWTGSDTAAPLGEEIFYVALDGNYQSSAAISNAVTLSAVTVPRVSQAFLDALRGPHGMDVRVVPYLGSTPVPVDGYPNGLPITGGTVTVDSTQRIRRQLTCTIGDPDLDPWLVSDLLSGMNGVELYVSWGLVYPDGSIEWCPIGLFHIEETDIAVSGTHEISIAQSSDRGGFVTDYRFTDATQSVVGATVSAEITRLLGLALPPGVANTTPAVSGNTTTVAPLMTWTSSDRWAAISQLEDAIGVEAFFDASGYPTVKPVATLADTSVWLVDAGAQGVMIEGTRKTGRTQTYNAVVARGERLDGTTPVQAIVVDNDPTSRTYWSGPFGKRPRFFTSPLLLDSGAAAGAAGALLAKVTGWTKVLTLDGPGNPALEASDVITIGYPDGSTEKAIVDQFTIPLSPADSQQITTRTYTPPSE